jgi:hypothetical protein
MITDFYKCDEHGTCDRCGCISSNLRNMDGQAVCTNCQEELDSITWDLRTNYVPLLSPQELAQFEGADTVSELLFTAQELACVACASTRKTVHSDRLALGTVRAVCCGEVA